jgi:hypothetical protein
VLVPELGRERLSPGCGLALWEQFRCVVPLMPARAERWWAVPLAVRQVGVVLIFGGAVVAVVLVVVAAVAAVVVVGPADVVLVLLESVGADVCGVVVPAVVVPGGGALEVWALRAALAPASQPFSALDMTSVLASSESRERQPASLPRVRCLRSMPRTLEGVPERRR